MPFNLGLGEVLVVLVVALLVFGGRLPQVGRSLGQGMREFKKGIRGVRSPVQDESPERIEAADSTDSTEPEVEPEPEDDAVGLDAETTPADRSP